MKKKFFEKLSKDIHKKLVEQGTSFSDISAEPDQIFLRHGYHKTSVIHIIRTAKDLGLVHIPNFVINVLYKKLVMGYSVYTFSYRA